MGHKTLESNILKEFMPLYSVLLSAREGEVSLRALKTVVPLTWRNTALKTVLATTQMDLTSLKTVGLGHLASDVPDLDLARRNGNKRLVALAPG